jgi:small-conductance mechanosensitive channel
MEILSDLEAQFFTYYDDFIRIIPRLVLAIIIVCLFILIARFISRKFIVFVNYKAEDKLLINFFEGVLKTIILIIGFLLFLYILGMSGIAGSILGAATISSVVIGFAFKDIAENFLAGVIMAFSRPFRIGDVVKISSEEGVIVEMSLRETHIKTADGKDVYIPNGQIIKNPLYNYTIDGFLRKSFIIGLDYGSDIEKGRGHIMEILPTIPGILTKNKAPRTLIKDLGASTINIEVQYWINTFDKKHSAPEIQSQVITAVLDKLTKEKFNMPGNILELKNYNNEFLQMTPGGRKPA